MTDLHHIILTADQVAECERAGQILWNIECLLGKFEVDSPGLDRASQLLANIAKQAHWGTQIVIDEPAKDAA